MGGNANETSTPTAEVSTSSDVEATGPLSILPICVSLIAVVALAIAACVFYRKRQRQQAQQLARQLRLTERRIHAVGNLTVKKEKELAARRSEYYPPSDVRASASEPSVIRPPHYFVNAGLNAIRAKAVQTSIVNASACSCEYGDSTYCSACKDSVLDSHRADSKATMEERDMSAGSLAVELATVPSVSSLTAVHTASKPPELRRTRSEFSQTSHSQNKTLQAVGYGSATSTPSREDATTASIRAWMAGSCSAKPSTSASRPFPHSPLYPVQPSHHPPSGPQLAMSPTNTTCTASEPEGRPNTPVSRSATSEEEGDAEQQAMEYTSDDALSEKWV